MWAVSERAVIQHELSHEPHAADLDVSVSQTMDDTVEPSSTGPKTHPAMASHVRSDAVSLLPYMEKEFAVPLLVDLPCQTSATKGRGDLDHVPGAHLGAC